MWRFIAPNTFRPGLESGCKNHIFGFPFPALPCMSQPSNMNLYIARDGESLGPYSEAQTREYVKAQVFSEEDLGCREGEETWRPLAELLPKPKVPAPPRTAPKPAAPVVVAPAQPKPTWMRWLWPAVGLAVLLAGWYFFLHPGEARGEVFVVTRGGQNYRLGLVPVALYSYKEVGPYLQKRLVESDKRLKELRELIDADNEQVRASNYRNSHVPDYDKWEAEEDALLNGAMTFRGLPQAKTVAQTDADGRFTLPVPKFGTYLIAAKSTREAGDSVERYYWMVRVSMNGAAGKTVYLSNNNMYPAE